MIVFVRMSRRRIGASGRFCHYRLLLFLLLLLLLLSRRRKETLKGIGSTCRCSRGGGGPKRARRTAAHFSGMGRRAHRNSRRSRPSGNFAFMIDIKGFSSRWIMKYLPVTRQIILFWRFLPIQWRIPLSRTRFLVGIKDSSAIEE